VKLEMLIARATSCQTE